MFRFIIIGFVLACAAAQFPYSIDEKIKCVIEYYLNEGSIGPYKIQKLFYNRISMDLRLWFGLEVGVVVELDHFSLMDLYLLKHILIY
jgi:hypothetical protein